MRGSIYKRCPCRDAEDRPVKGCRKAHGSWTFHVSQIDPATGKRLQQGKGGFPTRADAEVALNAVLTEINNGRWAKTRRYTLAEWFDEWISMPQVAALSPSTLKSYRAHFHDAWLPRLGRTLLHELRRTHVEAVLADLGRPLDDTARSGRAGRRTAQRSPLTLDSYRRTLRAALAVAHRRGLIVENPAQGRMESIPRRTVRSLVMWEPEETARFLAHVQTERLSALFEVAAYTGLRRAELCGMRWSDLDEGYRGLEVAHTIVEIGSRDVPPDKKVCPLCEREHKGLLLKPPKSAAGERWVPLAEPARRALVAHRARQEEERAEFGPDYADHGLVFCRPTGDPLRPTSVTDAFQTLSAACGLPVIRLHDTRHGACSLLLAGGVPIEVVQMILGHSSPDVTRRVYRHMLRGHTAAQVEGAATLLSKHR